AVYRDHHSIPTRRSSDLPSSTLYLSLPLARAVTFILAPEALDTTAISWPLETCSPSATSHLSRINLSTMPAVHPGTGIILTSARSEEHTSELQSRENLVC